MDKADGNNICNRYLQRSAQRTAFGDSLADETPSKAIIIGSFTSYDMPHTIVASRRNCVLHCTRRIELCDILDYKGLMQTTSACHRHASHQCLTMMLDDDRQTITHCVMSFFFFF